MNERTKPEKILDAAAAIVRRDGVAKLTLEAAAKEAGVSKGGLLYHFPNKESLIDGMVTRCSNTFVEDVEGRATLDPIQTGKYSRAFLEATFKELEEGLEISSGMHASLFTNPEMLECLQEHYRTWKEKMENEGLDPVTANIIRLASDGLWYADLFGMAPLEKELREKVFSQLSAWTKKLK